MGDKKKTLKSMAEALGVSPVTVYYALSGKGKVAESTKEKISNYAAKLGYTRREQKSKSIVFMIDSISGLYYIGLIEGVEAILKANHYDMYIYVPGNGSPESIFSFIENKKACGVIATYSFVEKYESYFEKLQIPAVFLDSDISNEQFSSVSIDDFNGTYTSTNYLLQNGYRNILFVGGFMYSGDTKRRFGGFKKAIEEYGLQVNPACVFNGIFTEKSGYNVANYIISSNALPEAIVAFNDEAAIGIINSFKEKGIEVPRDIAIVGFDNVDTAQYIGLTTMDAKRRERGTVAASCLFQLMSGAKGTNIIIPAELVVRKSCGIVAK